MKRYQKQLEKLREQTENFTKPFVDSSSSDESDLDGEVIKKVKADVDEIDVNKNEKIEENKEEAASKDNNENIKKNKSSSLKIAIVRTGSFLLFLLNEFMIYFLHKNKKVYNY